MQRLFKKLIILVVMLPLVLAACGGSSTTSNQTSSNGGNSSRSNIKFYVITHGQNLMQTYATQVSPEDRWAVVHYIRALQRSKRIQKAGRGCDAR